MKKAEECTCLDYDSDFLTIYYCTGYTQMYKHPSVFLVPYLIYSSTKLLNIDLSSLICTC